jgi:hypothetical protein
MDFGVAHREAGPGTSKRGAEITDEVAAGCHVYVETSFGRMPLRDLPMM